MPSTVVKYYDTDSNIESFKYTGCTYYYTTNLFNTFNYLKYNECTFLQSSINYTLYLVNHKESISNLLNNCYSIKWTGLLATEGKLLANTRLTF